MTHFVDRRKGNGSVRRKRRRARGVRHRATALAERLASKDIGEIVAVLVAAAKAGDVPSATLLLNRLWPPPKGRLVQFELPPIQSAADGEAAIGAVLSAVAAGKRAGWRKNDEKPQ